jgi:hypothetical protein
LSFEFCALRFAFWVTSRNFDALVRQLRLKTQNAKRKICICCNVQWNTVIETPLFPANEFAF